MVVRGRLLNSAYLIIRNKILKIEIVGAHKTCAPCRKISLALDTAGVDFTFYDMAEEISERYEVLTSVLRSRGVRRIPALFINDEYQEVETAQDELIKQGVLH
jgi:glutaredoxin